MIDIEKYKQKALEILSPIKEANNSTKAKRNFLFDAERSDASRNLPEYYLIYFLFSDLLGFKNLGQFEKIAWSFPIDYNGKPFLIEYRKFGVGIFVEDKNEDKKAAEEIAKKINGAVKSCRPFYDFLAEDAVKKSKFNINNNNLELFERFNYLKKLYKAEYAKYLKYKGQTKTTVKKSKYGESRHIHSLEYPYQQKANWLAISCIEAFYSWTEHLFIHLAVINSGLKDGEEISKLINAEWKTKFKSAIPLKSNLETNFLNELSVIKQQLRNFVAHGAFGKDGNAFKFHSGTGAVPVLMHHKRSKNKFSLSGNLSFDNQKVIELIEEFIAYLWNGDLKPAMIYTQEFELPTILTYAQNGLYKTAIVSDVVMEKVADKISSMIDNAANMDW